MGSSANNPPKWGAMKILIVDQDNEFRFWARSVFRKKGVMEVYSTASGAEALEILKNNDVDIGLVDLVMDDIDGVQFIRELRDAANNKQADMPVVLLTRSVDMEQLAPAFDAGVENLIQKPVSEAILLQRTARTATNPQRVVLKGTAKKKKRRDKDAGDDKSAKRAVRPRDRSGTSEEPTAERGRRPATRSGGAAAGLGAAGRRPTGGGTLGDFADDADEAPKPSGDDGWADDFETPAGARGKAGSEEDWNAELDKTSSEKKKRTNTDEDWNATFEDEDKEVRTGDDVEEIDIDAILEQHGLWLETRTEQGQRANLEKLDIAGIDLSGKDLSNANLRSADLSDAQCVGTVFQSADMRSASLSGAILREADLTVAKLRHADLRFCDLTAAVLKDSDLAGAQLKGVKAQEADFTGANMLHTDLEGADLSEATGLTQAQVGKAVGDTSTSLPSRIRLIIKEDDA